MINTYKFSGWEIECPHCKFKEYVDEEDIAFDPNDNIIHIVECEKCREEFEIETE